MWVLWLVITAVIVLIIIGFSKQTRANRPSAREILDMRYAKGDIDEVEYNKKKERLDQE